MSNRKSEDTERDLKQAARRFGEAVVVNMTMRRCCGAWARHSHG
jgi:hypothetical protein